MSDRLYMSGSFSSMGTYKSKAGADERKKTWSFVVLYAILGSAVLVTLFSLGISLLSAKVEVRGAVLVSADEILRVAGFGEKTSVFALDAARAEVALEAYYRVRTAHVEYIFPGKIIITVEERSPVGMIVAETEAGTSDLVCIDADGTIIGGEAEYPSDSALPVFSGIVLKNYRNGNRLDERFLPSLQSLARLKQENPKLMEAFSEFQFVEKTKGYIELLAYPVMYRTPLRLGATVDAASLQVGIWILDAMRDKTGADAMAELDLRGKIYTAKFKEAVSG